MNAASRLALFGAGLAVAFGSAAALGGAIGPDRMPVAATNAHAGDGGHAPSQGDHEAPPEAAGLQSTEQGYQLIPDKSVIPARQRASFSFKVVGPDGRPLTAYTRAHDKDLHLVVVRRDLTGYQHVHPMRAADGTWSAELDLSQAGQWRVFADFDPAGPVEGLVLGTDLAVPGVYDPEPLPPAEKSADTGRYSVSLAGNLLLGAPSPLVFTIGDAGGPVTDLQPYLAAYGHLVVLREGDLAYAHAHPVGQPPKVGQTAGPAVGFNVETPGPGRYRMFLDFQHAGTVHTAAFTGEAHQGERHGK